MLFFTFLWDVVSDYPVVDELLKEADAAAPRFTEAVDDVQNKFVTYRLGGMDFCVLIVYNKGFTSIRK